MTSGTSTGIPGLDKLIGGLRPGDSVFWLVDERARFQEQAERFAKACRRCKQKVVRVHWHPADCRAAKKARGDSSFCFDVKRPVNKQLNVFFDFAKSHAGDCFIVDVPPIEKRSLKRRPTTKPNKRQPARKPPSAEELVLMKFLGKIFAQLYWLDCVAYFGFLESQFGSESLLLHEGIPRILIQFRADGDITTLRIVRAPRRPSVDTQVVYALRGKELTPLKPGEPSLSDFRHIVERERSAVWLLGLNKELIYISRGMLGLSREELRANSRALLTDAGGSGAAAPLLSAMKEALKTGKPVTSLETTNLDRKSGSTEYLVHDIIPLLDKEGRPYGFLGTSTNVSEIRKREELLRKSEGELRRLADQLKESEKRYKDLFSSATDVITVIDRTGRVVDVNPECCNLTGYSREELLTMNCADLVVEFDRERFLSIFDPGSRPWARRAEYTFVRKDGTRVPFDVSVVLLDKNHALFVSHDVTERKTAEAKLRASEEMFRGLFEQAGMGMTYLDTNGEYVDVNDAFCRMTGYSREDFLKAKNLHPHWPEGYLERNEKLIRQGASGKAKLQETFFKKRSGELFPVRIHPSKVFDHTGKMLGSIGLIEDITGLKELEQQVIQSQRKEVASFLAVGIAHEFNNLHGGIQNHVELILDEENLPPQTRKDLEVILRTLQRAASITKKLDTFARRTPPQKEPCNIGDIIDETLELVSRDYENEGIRIEVRGQRRLPEIVLDGAQIGQVLLNLLINARDAMLGSENKVIKIETGVQGKRLFLKVSDSGGGIPAENVQRIFDPFFTTKGKVNGKEAHGLGLGLTVSRTIVKDHRGDIEVSSECGVGTTFAVWLPLEEGGKYGTA